MWCNVGFAKPVLLECLDDDPVYTDKEEVFTYLSLDLDKKDFEVVAVKTVLKDDLEGTIPDCFDSNFLLIIKRIK